MPVRRDSRTGRWYFRTTVAFADGHRERLYGTPGTVGDYQDLPNTKVGAQEAERRAIAVALRGKQGPTAAKEDSKTIRAQADAFLETYKPGQKPGERREKRRVMKSNLLPFFGDKSIEQLTQSDVDRFAQHELERGMKVKTVNNRLAVLSTMIKYVNGERSKLRFKLDGMDAELHAVAPDDVDRLLAMTEDVRYEAIILLASEAGFRAGEIRGVQRSDVKDGIATIRRALDKRTNEAVAPKHNKIRGVPLSPRLESVLKRLPRTGLWLVSEADGSFITYDRMIERVNELYVQAGVPRPPKPIHCLRHTFGTVMAKKVPLPVLRDLMGHSDIQTTLRYVDVNEGQKRDAIAEVFGAGSGAAAKGAARETKDVNR